VICTIVTGAPSNPPTPAKPPDVSLVLVNYNTAYLFDELFAALAASRGALKLQVILIDNASRDGSVNILRTKYPNVELIENTMNVGFGRANNQALPWVRGRYMLLLNTDAFVAPDTLQTTLDFMDAHPRCGVLGVKLVGRDGALQPSCRYFPTPWNVFLARTGLKRFFPGTRLVDDMSWDHASVRECDWVPGCFYLVRREVIERVGLFDPRFFLYYEEIDHCRRVRQAGWSVTYCPFTQVMHVAGESAATDGPLTSGRQIFERQIESELLYFRKHYGMTGVLASALLMTLSDVIKAGSGLLRHGDPARTASALQHAWGVLGLLFDTRLASRPTR
jgi:GT2 family glycosyltransferase